jgi:hypothetical protein
VTVALKASGSKTFVFQRIVYTNPPREKKKTDLPPYCAQSVVGQDVSDVRFEFRLQISLPVPRVGSRSLGLNRWGRITELWKSIWKSMCQPARFCQLFWYSSGFRGLAVSQPLLQSPQVLCKIFPA